jgi:hypothetical protein
MAVRAQEAKILWLAVPVPTVDVVDVQYKRSLTPDWLRFAILALVADTDFEESPAQERWLSAWTVRRHFHQNLSGVESRSVFSCIVASSDEV